MASGCPGTLTPIRSTWRAAPAVSSRAALRGVDRDRKHPGQVVAAACRDDAVHGAVARGHRGQGAWHAVAADGHNDAVGCGRVLCELRGVAQTGGLGDLAVGAGGRESGRDLGDDRQGPATADRRIDDEAEAGHV